MKTEIIISSILFQSVVLAQPISVTPEVKTKDVIDYSQYLFRPHYVIAGQGDISSPDAKITNSTMAAGIGLGYESPRTIITFFMRKGSVDNIGAYTDNNGNVHQGNRNELGSSLLDPLNSNYNFYLSGSFYPNFLWMKDNSNLRPHFGLRIYTVASDINWTYIDNDSIQSVQTTPLGIGICPSVYSYSTLTNDVKSLLYTHICLSVRYIGGDYSLLSNNEQESILHNKRKTFIGGEGEFGIHLGTLAVSVHVFMFPYNVSGLSSFHFIPVVGVNAPIEFPTK